MATEPNSSDSWGVRRIGPHLEEFETVTDPISAFVVAFAAAMTLAILGFVGRYVRRRFGTE